MLAHAFALPPTPKTPSTHTNVTKAMSPCPLVTKWRDVQNVHPTPSAVNASPVRNLPPEEDSVSTVILLIANLVRLMESAQFVLMENLLILQEVLVTHAQPIVKAVTPIINVKFAVLDIKKLMMLV